MKDAILIIDDVSIDRDILEDMLSDEYVIYTAKDGKEALEVMLEHGDEIVAILLDLIMPRMNGYELLEKFNELKISADKPVLIISGENSLESEEKCISLGATDYVRKPFSHTIVRHKVVNMTRGYSQRKGLEHQVAEQMHTIKKRSNNLILLLAGIVETRDVESGTHVKRVQGYTSILAHKLMDKYPSYKLDDEKIRLIVSGSALHDVGKIGIKDAILLKEGKLTEDEFETMKEHTTIGAEFIDSADDVWDTDYFEIIHDIVKYHHEKYDGHGYPEGLKGNDIPISAQIVSIADVFDALINKRCYKEAYDKKVAYKMILDGECGQFNPDLIDCFIESFDDFVALADKMDA